MSRRRRNKRLARQAAQLRWWLVHHAGCVVCSYGVDATDEFSRWGHAIVAIAEYRAQVDYNLRRPVRIPRRFWARLGRET